MYIVNSQKLLLRIRYADKTNYGYNDSQDLDITEFYCLSSNLKCKVLRIGFHFFTFFNRNAMGRELFELNSKLLFSL